MMFLLWCRVCEPEPSPDNVMPFESPAERGKWAAEHTRGTGHDRWLVFDVPPDLGVPKRFVFGVAQDNPPGAPQ
ncbi:hypothetical protein [Pseudonocardia sp. N23]|uniref:hypothetical protein n=1 Tax=Pseudonocardia sp. N23 TaxID=1987376 RepID=UPI000BFB9165|nr:hypothetical protein [Pseudonocardia sp. N23]GAY12048.1 hypothetical protein TOK_0438 [Pseudonocardia sp. N23]